MREYYYSDNNVEYLEELGVNGECSVEVEYSFPVARSQLCHTTFKVGLKKGSLS